jgi:hypothetical protein
LQNRISCHADENRHPVFVEKHEGYWIPSATGGFAGMTPFGSFAKACEVD